LFLDEIGDMPLAVQAKLLRALQEQEVEPLGSNQVVKVDVRVIAATSRDLAAMVAEGRFRADLYYRLNVLPIRLPALRERITDLEAMADALLDDIARRGGLPHKSLSSEALDLLMRQRWPGNIRELRNVLEQAALMTDDMLLAPWHFAAALQLDADARAAALQAVPEQPARMAQPAAATLPAAAVPVAADAPQPRPLPEQVAELERAAIGAALRATAGNKLAAARMLRISRAAFYDKLARYPELAQLGR
jgi:DNA-binding NtrC family response regulator